MTSDHVTILDTGTRPARACDSSVELVHRPALVRRSVDFDVDRVRRCLARPCHLVFYSRFSARVVAEADVIDPADGHRFWAVGEHTAAWLEDHFDVGVEFPDDERFEGLRYHLSACGLPRPIVAFGLRGTRRDLSDLTARWDVDFTTVAVYESAPCEPAVLQRAFDHHRPQWMTVTSSRGVRSVVDALGIERLTALQQTGALRIAAIGPSTAETLDELGLRADIVPDSPDRNELVAAIARSAPT